MVRMANTELGSPVNRFTIMARRWETAIVHLAV